jgi:hypothetical protein
VRIEAVPREQENQMPCRLQTGTVVLARHSSLLIRLCARAPVLYAGDIARCGSTTPQDTTMIDDWDHLREAWEQANAGWKITDFRSKGGDGQTGPYRITAVRDDEHLTGSGETPGTALAHLTEAVLGRS